MSDKDSGSAIYPPVKSGWFLVVMLTIAYIFSFIDRYILGLLIEPIKADLGLTDEQIGWVIGPAFAIFYATMGLPLGWLVDRSKRTWIVAAGIFVWSLATAVSGLAKSFWHLFVARMMVGVGEATLSPSAMSMIADSFPPEKRGKPISVYVAALSLGSGIASLIGGAVLIWAKTTPSVSVPLFGALAPWQLTFFAVGFPGIFLGLIFFFLKEPPRQVAELDSDLEGNNIRDALTYVSRRAGTYGTFISMAAVMAIIAYSQGFLPATFERTWAWPAEKYALINGVALLIFGPATVFITGIISDRWTQSGIADAPLRLMIVGFLIMLPTAILPMFMPSPEIAYAILCLNTVGIAMISGMAITALLAITPGQIRGQVVALYYMAISMAGLFLGPSTVGILSTRVFGEDNIRFAMATLPVVYGIVPLLCIPLAIRFYRRQLDHMLRQRDS
ncbi:MAG: MFS transporter [Parasphingorhabdus sp.]|uniref:MFS transporter n=1 Tax=Parasphingorhabdus sp. TaxID=2709688 RepID=UPI00329976BB